MVRTKQGPHPHKKYVQEILHIPEPSNVGNMADILGEKNEKTLSCVTTCMVTASRGAPGTCRHVEGSGSGRVWLFVCQTADRPGSGRRPLSLDFPVARLNEALPTRELMSVSGRVSAPLRKLLCWLDRQYVGVRDWLYSPRSAWVL
jgi:hypothetical protein